MLALFRTFGEAAGFTDGDGRAFATIHPARPEVGAIGDWVGTPEVLRAAEVWLAERGCTVARGPMEMCRWFGYRATLGPTDEPPFAFEPTTPAGRWVDAGYAELQRFASIVADRDALIGAGVDRAAGLAARGYTVSPLPTGTDGMIAPGTFKEGLETVHRLFSEAFEQVEGYVPIPAHALFAYYSRFHSHLDPRLTLLARDPSGDPVGIVLAVPDHAQPERGWYLVLTQAVRPDHRRLGVGTWLIAAVHQRARRAGYRSGVHCFMRDEGQGRLSRGQVFRRYALLEKSLVTSSATTSSSFPPVA